ncbi:MAG: 6,7-dimethyl-8-ribityllumazine synthase [Verrucomicrobiales bacterium]|nr:6,7-dimethyl-8-ribityllumazine synthase [Verrucomicrobiales bacterium]
MSAEKSAPSTPSENQADTSRIAIVASRYNAKFTDALVESANETLSKLLPSAVIETHRVPGAFEIPVVVEALCQKKVADAVIALGVIIRGSTAHADLIAESITHSLHASSRAHLIPVIHEVLLVANAEQAEARSLGDELNRGREAAEAAVEMLGVMRNL